MEVRILHYMEQTLKHISDQKSREQLAKDRTSKAVKSIEFNELMNRRLADLGLGVTRRATRDDNK